jgi:hypothetical protein
LDLHIFSYYSILFLHVPGCREETREGSEEGNKAKWKKSFKKDESVGIKQGRNKGRKVRLEGRSNEDI